MLTHETKCSLALRLQYRWGGESLVHNSLGPRLSPPAFLRRELGTEARHTMSAHAHHITNPDTDTNITQIIIVDMISKASPQNFCAIVWVSRRQATGISPALPVEASADFELILILS